MKGFKSKGGISLIVLVITIIVMIILAAAIILSISNSGIMDKANQAKTESDTANLKEYVNVLEAEWELMTADERSSSGYASKEEYVNKKLADKGYTSAYMTSDETLYTNLQSNARAALEAGIKIGDVVTGYTLDSTKTSYTTSGNENTAPTGTGSEGTPTTQTVTRIEYDPEKWRYIGIGENGEVLIAPDMVTTSATTAQKIKLSGKGGYLNGPKELNDMCAAMYSTSKGTARSMNIDDITRILDYTGDRGYYCSAAGEDVWTKTPKKISEIGTLSYTSTPDGSDIGEYYADYYNINKTIDDILKSASDSLKTTLTNFVYTSNIYWLASSCVNATFDDGFATFGVRCVASFDVDAYYLFFSINESDCYGCVGRPAVSLESNIQLTKVSDGNWSI